MSSYSIYHDAQRCIGCYACEVHCKTNKDLPVGPRLCRIFPVESGALTSGGAPRVQFVFVACQHCEKPWCVDACPTGAMQRRSADGIVFVDHAMCVGCKSCVTACPFGAMQWDTERGKVVKCDYCKDRVDAGLEPACVTKCTTHALHFVAAVDASTLKRERYARELAGGEPTPSAPGGGERAP